MSDFSTIDEAIEELRAGRMIVLVDDEYRENEGDLVIAAEKVTPEAINFIVRNLGRTILQRYGYRVLLAEDGLEALQLYRQHTEPIDLVILDLVMPRLSGHDTLRQLQQLDPRIRVLFSSGYSAEQVTESIQDGVLGFVHKPYRPQELAQKVRGILDEIQRQRQTA